MSCFGLGRAEREKAELREMLELANAQREEFRKAAERSLRDGQEFARKLERSQRELAELQHRLQSSTQHEAQLTNENHNLELKVAGLHAALDKAAMQQERDDERIRQAETQRDAALAEARKLSKDREYLKHRVERMQKALSMLESVLDDTLRESQASDVQRGHAMAALRRSMELCSDGSAPRDVGPLMSSVHQQLQELMQQSDRPNSRTSARSSPTRTSDGAFGHSPRGRSSSSRRGPDGLPTGLPSTSATAATAAAAAAAAGKAPADIWRAPRDQRYSTRN